MNEKQRIGNDFVDDLRKYMTISGNYSRIYMVTSDYLELVGVRNFE